MENCRQLRGQTFSWPGLESLTRGCAFLFYCRELNQADNNQILKKFDCFGIVATLRNLPASQ
jgi:hypothetical protein